MNKDIKIIINGKQLEFDLDDCEGDLDCLETICSAVCEELTPDFNGYYNLSREEY